MRRRQCLRVIAAAVTAGAAGCADASSDERPDDVVEAYYRALNDGDLERATELVHEDSDERPSEMTILATRELRLEVETTDVLDETDDTASVRVELTIDDGDGEETTEETHELRTEDGAWKLYD